MNGRVEVSIVSDIGWEVHDGLTLRHKGSAINSRQAIRNYGTVTCQIPVATPVSVSKTLKHDALLFRRDVKPLVLFALNQKERFDLVSLQNLVNHYTVLVSLQNLVNHYTVLSKTKRSRSHTCNSKVAPDALQESTES